MNNGKQLQIYSNLVLLVSAIQMLKLCVEII